MAENFSWASAIDVGIGAAKGLIGWLQSDNQAIVAEGARKARNTVNASKNSLAATVRSINNQILMEAAAKQVEAEGINLSRLREASAGGRFEQSIRNQEAAGARAASIAASGVGGIGLAAVEGAMALQQGRLEFAAQQREGQLAYNSMARLSGFVPDAIGQQDRSMIGGNMDFVENRSSNGGAVGLLTALTAGALSKRDSLQTMLGSLEPALPATSMPVSSPTATPFDLPQEVSTPVQQSTITGTDLPLMGDMTGRPTLSIDNTLGGV